MNNQFLIKTTPRYIWLRIPKNLLESPQKEKIQHPPRVKPTRRSPRKLTEEDVLKMSEQAMKEYAEGKTEPVDKFVRRELPHLAHLLE